jgi:hypothetical protein
MLIDSTNTDIVIAFAGGLVALLMIVYFDLYLRRRRVSAINAAYLARMHASRIDSRVHQMGRAGRFRNDMRFTDLTCESQIESSAPGFFSRKRIISDRLGRVVATHYEELVVPDLYRRAPQPRLMLRSGSV